MHGKNNITNESIKNEFLNSSSLDAVNQYFPEATRKDMGKMVEQLVRNNKNILSILRFGQILPGTLGFAAEKQYAESFDLDAIMKKKVCHALTITDTSPKLEPEFGARPGDVLDVRAGFLGQRPFRCDHPSSRGRGGEASGPRLVGRVHRREHGGILPS